MNQRPAPPSGMAPPELSWLGRVLEAREFPLPRLAWCLELLGQTTQERVPDEPQIAERFRQGAVFIASHESFLTCGQ